MSERRRHIPVRTCVGCRQRDSQASLLRLRVADDGGSLRVVGIHREGRSAYVHEQRSCLVQLTGSRTLGRSLRSHVSKTTRTEFVAELCAAEGSRV